MVQSMSATARTGSPLDGRGGVDNLVVKALSMLKSKESAIATDYSSPQLSKICDAFVATDDEVRHTLIEHLMANGLTATDIIEHIIPSTATLLGERWATDKLSFADVTIGTARLQETVRALTSKRSSESRLDGDCILLAVPRNEHHTLGAFVAAHQFRAEGIEVRLAIGMHPTQIAMLVRKHRFPAVGITASSRRSLADAREMINSVRTALPKITPVIIGGNATQLPLDIVSMTGADYVTSDPRRAIKLCSLKRSAAMEYAAE